MIARSPMNSPRALTFIALVLAATACTAQTPAPHTISELLSALKDPGITTIRKNELVGHVYTGDVKVSDVTKCEPDAKCKARIFVEPGIASPLPLKLEFATNDAARAERLKKGDIVRLSGKLARFLDFPPHRENPNGTDLAMFDQAVFVKK